MKYNFIIPSWSYWVEPVRAQPLTALYLATILENEGNEVRLTDFRDGPKEVKDADYYLYTVASPDIIEVEGIVKTIRSKQPGRHIAGGPHVNIFPEESLKTFDSIVLGNGEEAIKKLISNKQIYSEPLKNIEYPYPERHFLSKDKIVTSLFKTEDIPSTTVLFSHGCPYKCSFCANYNRQPIRKRSLESISDEIDYLKSDYKIRGLSLQDEICIDKEPNDFLALMAGKDIYWRGQTRAGIPKEVLKKAKNSGCIELSIGLESVDQHVLNIARKGMKVSTVKQTLNYCKDVGIKTRLYLLNGLPGEPKDIVKQTINFINENEPDVVLLSTLQPYPGSDIYNNPEKYGISYIDKDFTKYNHLRCRFADSKDKLEEVVPFKYYKNKGFSRQKIMNNLNILQEYLRDRGVNK